MAELPHMSDEQWLEEVRAAHVKRAEFYYRMFCELRDEFGEPKAIEVMGRACRKIGQRQGRETYAPKMSEQTAQAFCEQFCGKGSVGVKLFEIARGPEEGAVAHAFLGRCALVDGWRRLGVSDNDIAAMCKAAREVDFGKLDEVGLQGEFTELLSEGGEKCNFRIEPKAD